VSGSIIALNRLVELHRIQPAGLCEKVPKHKVHARGYLPVFSCKRTDNADRSGDNYQQSHRNASRLPGENSFIEKRSLGYSGEIFLPGSVNPFFHPFVDQGTGLTTVVLSFTVTFV
jgi:hypothetical protein